MGLLSVCGNVVRIGNNTISAGAPDPEIYVTPASITGVTYLGATCSVNVCGNRNNSVVVADACTWLVVTTPVSPSNPPGTVNNIEICENITSSCRCGVVCYTPSLGGTMKCVTICQSTGDTNICVTPASQTSICGDGAYVYEYVCGPISNSTSFSTACSWIHATSPVSPCASPGRIHVVCVDANTVCACRCGTICYTPTCGTMRTITICQNQCITWKTVSYQTYSENGSEGYFYDDKCVCFTYGSARAVGDCYCMCTNAFGFIDSGSLGCGCFLICCNGTPIYSCIWDYNQVYANIYHEYCVDYNDAIVLRMFICENGSGYSNNICLESPYIINCSSSCSSFCNGTTCQDVCVCTS
jgi:hypothetical protein